MKKIGVWLITPAKLARIAILVFLSCQAFSAAFAACHVVTPSGSGTKTGADWNNAFAGLPSTLVRGDIYYLADGNYGHNLTLSQPDSGTSVIELRKAQSYDNCTATGWNTSTMGSSQAIWTWGNPGSMVRITSDYWTINGNGQPGATEVGCGGVQANPGASLTSPPPNPAGCGIKIDASTCTETSNDGCDGGMGEMDGAGINITWESVEWEGQGLNSNGNNNSETYFWRNLGSTNMVVTHCYCHNASTTYVTNVSWNNATISYNYFWGLFDGSVNHGEALQDTGSDSNTSIFNNIFRDQTTNGDLVFVDPVSGTHNNFAFYNNVDFCSSGNSCRHNDGFIACINNSQTCTNFHVYQNTIGPGITSNCGIVTTNVGSYTVENNLWYNCAGASVSGTGFTQDHNSFLNTSGPSGTANVNITSGAPDPFVNWAAGNFNLASDNSDWNNRISLSAPYNTDIADDIFTSDRGAYQFETTNAPSAPASLTSSATLQP
jgi:hypothetical protein